MHTVIALCLLGISALAGAAPITADVSVGFTIVAHCHDDAEDVHDDDEAPEDDDERHHDDESGNGGKHGQDGSKVKNYPASMHQDKLEPRRSDTANCSNDALHKKSRSLEARNRIGRDERIWLSLSFRERAYTYAEMQGSVNSRSAMRLNRPGKRGGSIT